MVVQTQADLESTKAGVEFLPIRIVEAASWHCGTFTVTFLLLSSLMRSLVFGKESAILSSNSGREQEFIVLLWVVQDCCLFVPQSLHTQVLAL